MVCSVLSLTGCDRTESVQWGERGTSMIHIDKPGRLNAAADIHAVPEPEPRDPPDPEIPLAKDVNQNVQVLTDLDALEFARLMQAISTWVAPKEGCEYCHNTENLASDEKYTKVVARQMLQMTRDINTNWKSHVVGTGVTCWTCHRGQAIPSGTWFTDPGPRTPSAGITGVKAGQNTAGMRTPGNASLPFDPLTPYLEGDTQVSVQGTTALPSGNQNTIKKTEWTYALMMYMSNSLGVNCTYCHQTRAMGVWEQSTPQRVTAWHGIRMVRDLNGTYLNPLKTLYPPERLGPTGDAPKVACETCHKGAFKPLLGVSMLGDYPELAGYRTERPGVAVAAADEAVAVEIVEAVPPETAPGDAEPVGKPASGAEPEVASVSEQEIALSSRADSVVPERTDTPAVTTAALAELQPRIAAAEARLEQERTALQQQLVVVRAQRDAAAAEAAARVAALAEEQAAALRAAEARLNQERTALQQQLVVVRAQRDAALADTEADSRIAALTQEMDALRRKLAEADEAASDLRSQMQAAASTHARELAEVRGAMASMRTLYEGAAELGGRVTGEGILFNLGGEELQFPSGSAILPSRELPTLDRLAELLAARADLKAKIGGHTDSSGNPQINEVLSRQRAEAVMQALIDRGVDPNRLSTEGFGADRPIADNATDRGRRQNRRVEVVMIGDAGGATSSSSDN
jgi:outer membrane protein OmpA-like peptidoglycan-associated protein